MGEGSGEPGLPFPTAQWTLATPDDHWAVPVCGVGSTGCAHRGPRKLKGLGKLQASTGACDIALCKSTEGAPVGFGNVELEFCLSLIRNVPSPVSALVLFGIDECCREGSSRYWRAPGRGEAEGQLSLLVLASWGHSPAVPPVIPLRVPWNSSAVQHRCHRHSWIHVGGFAVPPGPSTSPGCGDAAVP